MKAQLVTLLIVLFTQSVFAQSGSVTLKGKAVQYAGLELTIQYVSNFITGETEKPGVMKVDDNGSFNVSLDIDEVTLAFMDMGTVRGYLFLEPGTTYEVVMPPYTPQKESDILNPYFKREELVLGIANKEAQKLNRKITEFDDEFNYLFTKNAYRLLGGSGLKTTREITAQLDSIFPSDDTSGFFYEYKKYRFAKLYILSLRRQKARVINDFFSNSPVLYNNPAYTESFLLMFKNFLDAYLSQKRGEELRQVFIKGAPFDTLSLILGNDTLYRNREFREVVLLKGLFDAFYSGKFNKDKINGLIKQAGEKGASEKVRKMAAGIYKKVNHLRIGSKAPALKVYTLKGKERSLSSYKGRFVYLNFANIENHSCRKDFQLLDALSKRMKRELTVVTVVTNNDPEKITEYIKKNKYQWDFLYSPDIMDVLAEYDITGLPVYFLIDPDGNLSLSPAPSPEENFTARFYEALKNYRYKKARKEKPNEKSIYQF
jgi:peroxiredoxin